MPVIPRLRRSETIDSPQISPGAVAAPYEAITRAGEQTERLGFWSSGVFEQIQKEQDRRQILDKTLEWENTLEEQSAKFLENLATRKDYENYDKDYDEAVNNIGKLSPKGYSWETPGLRRAWDKAYGDFSRDLKKVVVAKKLKDSQEKIMSEFIKIEDRELSKFTNEPDPELRGIIFDKYSARVMALAAQGVMPLDRAEQRIIAFREGGSKGLIDQADVTADQAIMKNPVEAYMALQNENYLPQLPPKVRQDKFEKAKKAVEVLQNENEKKIKEQQTIAHDTEEKEIVKLLGAGQYSKAFSMAQSAKFLKADEIDKWSQAAKGRAEVKEETLSPTVESAEIVKINGMISREEDPKAIRDYIVSTPRLGKENREQYIGKLESKLTQEVKDGRNSGYRDIQDMIIPKRSMLSNMLESPAETMAVKKAQMALDDWIDSQAKGGKTPTSREIRLKAQSLATDYPVHFSQKVEGLEEESKDVIRQMKELADKKAKQKKDAEEYDRLKKAGKLIPIK